jgi:hypothetical protein
LQRVTEERNILHTIKRRKVNSVGHVLSRSCLLKHVIKENIEGKVEVTEKQGRRLKQLLDDVKKWTLEIERGRTRSNILGTRCGRGCGPVVRGTI